MKNIDHKSSDNKNSEHKLSGVIYILLIILILAVFIELKYEIKSANDNVKQLNAFVDQVNDENKELEDELKCKQMEIELLADIYDIKNSIYNKMKDFSLNEIPEFVISDYLGSKEINNEIIEI